MLKTENFTENVNTNNSCDKQSKLGGSCITSVLIGATLIGFWASIYSILEEDELQEIQISRNTTLNNSELICEESETFDLVVEEKELCSEVGYIVHHGQNGCFVYSPEGVAICYFFDCTQVNSLLAPAW